MSENRSWLKNYPEEIPSSLTYDSKPLQQYLIKAAEDYPENAQSILWGKRSLIKNF